MELVSMESASTPFCSSGALTSSSCLSPSSAPSPSLFFRGVLSHQWRSSSVQSLAMSGKALRGNQNFRFLHGSEIRLVKRKAAPGIFASSATAVPSPSSSSPDGSSALISDTLWPALGAFVAMFAMSALDTVIEPMGLKFTIAPFGAVCAVLFSAPNTPAAKKYNMFLAHIGCAAIGVASLFLFGPGWLARSMSLAASLAFMQLTKCLHPPAAGLPLLFIDAPKFHQLQWWYIIFPSAIGCIILCLLQEAVMFLRKNWRF